MEQPVKAASGNGLSFNPHVAALPPYNAGMNVETARALSGRRDIARLASNENPDGCSPAVMAALNAWRETGYETHVRATIGVPADNDRLIAALQRTIGR